MPDNVTALLAMSGGGSVDPEKIAEVTSEWLEENIATPSTPPIDSSLTVANAAADAKATGDQVNELKSAIGNMPIIFNGYISAGKWLKTSSPRSTIIPVSGGEKIRITANATRYTYYAGLTQFDNPQDADIPSFSSSAGWTSNIYLGAGVTAEKTLPSDVKFLYIFDGEQNAAKPSVISVGEYDYAKPLSSNVIPYILTDLAKARLINCALNMSWITANGNKILQLFCDSIGVAGWIGVVPKCSIDGSTGLIDKSVSVNRQASEFVNVHGFVSIKGVLLDKLEYPVYFSVRCYDSDKKYLGTAQTNTGSTVPANGDTMRNLLNNTAYIRLLFTPGGSAPSSQDLGGVYTSRMLGLYLYDSSNNETFKRFELNEIEEFES